MVTSEHIGSEAFEARLKTLKREAANDVEGLFGPQSVFWRVNRESAVFLGAGRALLLQIAHPAVAQAIEDHSPVKRDPWGRYYRTMRPVFTMVFGTVEQALAEARAVRSIHERISGVYPERAGPFAEGGVYSASDMQAALWVYATLVHTALQCYELALPPLTRRERDRYYREGRRFAALFGIPPELPPADAPAFEAYMDEIVRGETLAVTPAGRAIADYFFGRASGAFGRYVPRWYTALTARLIPERLREGFGLAWGAREQASARRALRLIAPLYPRLPGALRHVGPYQEARGRLCGGNSPGPWTRTLNRLWIGQAGMGR